MRILFTVQPSTGHLHPLVPVARAAQRAGHEVAVCSAASFRPDVEAFGLTHIAAGIDWLAADHSTWTAFPPMPPPGPDFGRFVVTVFADITAGRMAPDVVSIARQWQADVIVREGMEYGGCLAAEVLGLPHASIAGNGYAAVDAPDLHYFPGNRRLVAEPLGRHRAALGLPADPGNAMPFRYLHLIFTPPAWDDLGMPRPENARFLRHENATKDDASLPRWIDELDDRPLVFASLGTVFNSTPGVLEAIIEALASMPVNAVVAIGPDQDRARFGSTPPHVRLESYVPQVQLLPRCAAFITHGGFNSVKESLISGTPMVVVPITADQPYCAQRCAALGLGAAIAPDERRPGKIRSETLNVLEDPAYRTRVLAFRDEMLALPGCDHAVGLLEKLAANHVNPTTTRAGAW